MNDPRKMALRTFLHHFAGDNRADRRFCFIIGAGASKQSGIPTGGELAEIWLKQIRELYSPEEVNAWTVAEGSTKKIRPRTTLRFMTNALR